VKIEADEIWGYVGKKQRQVAEGNHTSLGDVWTFIAIDSESKAVPSFPIGKRDYASTRAFVADVHSRMKNRIQLSSNGMNHYAHAVEESFGSEVDYGQIVKVYKSQEPEGRYSPPQIEAVKRTTITGNPHRVSTSIIER